MRSFHFTVKAKLHIAGTAMGIGLRESDTPRPGPGQVLMRVRASALNFADLTFLSGRLPKAEGVIPLLDGAGEIVAIGAGVTRWQVGERVVANPHQSWLAGEARPSSYGQVLGGTVDGMLRDYAVLPETGLATMPAHLSFEEAAALPCAGLTAWNSILGGPLLKRPGVPGEAVLVQGTITCQRAKEYRGSHRRFEEPGSLCAR